MFFGQGFSNVLTRSAKLNDGAIIFGYYVNNPKQFGVVDFDDNKNVVSIEEKPDNPKSNYVVPGLYFYDNRVVDYAKNLEPSDRGELEITDLNKIYLEEGDLDVQLLGRGFAWLDTGKMDTLLEAAEFVRTIEHRQGIKISALEEIAYRNDWIDKETLLDSAEKYGNSPYGQFLKKVAEDKIRY